MHFLVEIANELHQDPLWILKAFSYILEIYFRVDDFLKQLPPLRTRGFPPKLSDAEVITMEIVGEIQGFGSDKAIYEYFKNHWFSWFPNLGCRTTFPRQCANICRVKKQIRDHFLYKTHVANDLFLFDGLPIPTCNPKRVRWKNPFYDEASFGYCAAKDKKYFGFKGHLYPVTKRMPSWRFGAQVQGCTKRTAKAEPERRTLKLLMTE
jgi:hypothetical protein